jgi:hypothetical protein
MQHYMIILICVHIYILYIYMCVCRIYIYYRISHSRSSHVRYPPPSGSQASHSQIPPGRSAERRSGRCPADVSAVKHSEWKSLNPPKMGWNVVKPRKICKNPDWTKLGHKKWSVESTINGDLNDLSRNKWGFNAQSMEFTLFGSVRKGCAAYSIWQRFHGENDDQPSDTGYFGVAYFQTNQHGAPQELCLEDDWLVATCHSSVPC